MKWSDQKLKLSFWCIALFLGATQAWLYRHEISSPDGISYLDVADAYASGNWQAAINAYWSPLYSWLLGILFLFWRPSPYWEFAAVKLLNFMIFGFSLACFEFFLRKLCTTSFWATRIIGYTLFLWTSLIWIGVQSDTPDMLVASFVYLIAGIILGFRETVRNRDFLWLGILLGFSYLAKAAMLTLAPVFLASAWLSTPSRKENFPKLLVALLVFIAVSAPFIAAVSLQKHRLTFGDAGKLNYAWFVNPGLPTPIHWQGEPEGTLKHSTRKFFDRPAAYEFGSPIHGTYPPWYDPSYWGDGVSSHFSMKKELPVLRRNFSFYLRHFLGVWLLGVLFLFRDRRNLINSWILFLPAAAGLGLYMVVKTHTSMRYLAPFAFLLFAALISCLRPFNSSRSLHRLRQLCGLMLFLFTLAFLVKIQAAPHDLSPFQIAEALSRLGIQPGSRVAIIGDEDDHVYWSRIARIKVVVQIPNLREFVQTDPATQLNLLNVIHDQGASAVVAKPETTEQNSFSGWKKAGDSGYYVRFLPIPETKK